MTIAEVSKLHELSQDTLRYYERIGLIPPVARNASGHRDYQQEDLRWVQFIKCMRSSGISIEVLIEYVAMFQQGDETSAARLALLVSQREMLMEKLVIMQQTIDRLDHKIERYEQRLKPIEDELKRVPKQ